MKKLISIVKDVSITQKVPWLLVIPVSNFVLTCFNDIYRQVHGLMKPNDWYDLNGQRGEGLEGL